ncbi:enterobactin transporter EntS [Nocardia sp. NPDC127526]|uniref:enterobactin transporter EntS n=1 Tax=Nocardia sp. NPDC127526 TaxID=3345393 RepID=UPI00363E7BCE
MTAVGGLLIDTSPLKASRGFRCAFAARLVSVLGIGLLMVALPVQVYQLTGSSLHVAGVTTVTAVALFAGSLAGGVIADRYDRRDVIQWSRSAAGLGFLALGVNALLPDPQLAVIYTAGVVDGLAGGISGSALMALVPQLVGREKLAAAGALTALTSDLGTMITPALAGLLIAETGVGPAFFIAAAATAATVGLIRAIGPSPAPARNTQHPLRELATGVQFAMRHNLIRAVLFTGLVAMLVSGPLVLLPAFVDVELGGGPTVLGLLYAAPGAGAVLGSLTSGWIGRSGRPGRALLLAVALMPLGVIAAGLWANAAWVFLGLAAFGLARAVSMVLRYTLLQQQSPEEFRGRISGLLMVQAVTGSAIGSMAAGVVGQLFAPDTAFLAYGIATLVLAGLAAAFAGPLYRLGGNDGAAPVPAPAPSHGKEEN